MPDLQKTTLNPPNAPKPLGAYSHAVKVSPGSLVYIAGQVGVDANGNLAGPDVEAQTRQVFQNLGHVLAGAGATFANLSGGKKLHTAIPRRSHPTVPQPIPQRRLPS